MWIYIWLGVLVLTLIIEFVTFELVSIWISFGALVSMILAACKVPYEVQIIVAVVVSIACIFGLRRFAMKYLTKTKIKTNIESMVSVRTKLLTAITDDNLGTVKHNGIVWSAKSEKGEKIEAETVVEIVGIDGNKLIVKEYKEKGE